MRTIKRLTAAILTAALALSLVVLPASAAPGSFIDVTDPNTAVNADILRLMGVVSGTGDNLFEPQGKLTRAQFCTMVVTFLQRQDETPQYETRTIFSDVKSSHWARGYINLAASISVSKDEENKVPLIAGVGDGRFLPDREISLAEAVTILLRALDYTGKEAGSVWPQGYLNLAKSIGLTDGLNGKAASYLTRGEAAQLFVNALKCKRQGGEVYYKSLPDCKVEEKTIVLAVNVQTDDGNASGAIRTTSSKVSEAYLPAHGSGNPVALQGKRGDLVLNAKEEIVTFVPDNSTATTISLVGDAQAAFVKGGGGQQYTISPDTPVFTTSGGSSTPYSEAYETLISGSQITMYTEKGKIVAVYSTSGTTTIDSDAVVVMGHASAATFHQLTGGVSSFKIIKDRQNITLSQIKPYDVVTYDQISNTLVVSDMRMTAVYTDPTPTPKTPTEIKVAGADFDVLQSAWDTIGDIKPGDSVSLLLTADGKVAGIVKPTAQTRSTAIGTLDGSSGVTLFLPNGTTRKLSGTVTNSASLSTGQPVIVSTGKGDNISVSRLSENRAPGAFDLNALKLGDLTVSTGVRIYEQTGSVVASINRGDLNMASIPANQISSYHTNSAGIVDYIVLNNVTGSAYVYGMMVGGYELVPSAPNIFGGGGETERYVWRLRNGEGELEFIPSATYRGSSGDMVGIVTGKPTSDFYKDQYTIQQVIKLTEVRFVKSSDFFDSQGDPHITAFGRTYRIADDVQCYYSRSGNKVAAENWLKGDNRLTSIKGYSDSFTIYVDPVGQQVRIIVAN